MAKILISGASIAGPALAYWLQNRHEITIVERAPAVRTGGYAIDIRGAALPIVERMGILPALRERSTDTLTNSFVDGRGRILATFDRGFGVLSPGDVEVLRGDLASLLVAATPNVRYVFGDSIAALHDDQSGIDVDFASGRQERFDLVVGADGLHSGVRALRFGPEEPLLRPLGSAIAIFNARNHLGLDCAQLMMMAPGRVASIKSDRGNESVKITLMFSIAEWSREPHAQRRAAKAAFGAFGFLQPFLEDIDDDFYADISSQTRMPSWHDGRVALVGDAAYAPSAMTGQGTSMALVGAYLLAQAIDRGDLAAYEASMRPFAERNQDVALQAARSFAPATAFGAWWRNINMRILPHLPWRGLIVDLMMRDIKRASQL